MTDEFKNRCNYVVVRNAAHSDSFVIFESSEVRVLLTNKLGGREITNMPRCLGVLRQIKCPI
jgi:hypothetical protein